MPPAALVARDHTLDIALESESRLILLIIAIAIGLLFIITAIVIHGSELLEIMRRYMRLSRSIAKEPGFEKTETANAPIMQATFVSSMPQSMSTPQIRQVPKYNTQQRISTTFFPLRKHPSAPHKPAGVYSGVKRMPFSAVPSENCDSRHPLQQASLPGIVTHHIAEWMKVADSVVGRHPDAQPLHMRVAMQAEVDLISGHVHIPWASKSRGRSPMVPVKIIAFPPPAANTGVLKDLSDIQSSKITVYIGNTLKSSSRPSKGKKMHRPRGKENLPPTSLPPVHVYSDRRN
ncbi:hypothetical protein CPB84DRAFT_1848040 [Gymnopilus junonius]|uniref:Uncharacterized protein n=1 Tax=Gymnopilus junonius TaxID=109634 RepID=A0A9P5NMN7_GYMJU|nr:hypothetical protein CPB84DRAFT_1848040 [Gymnopilus junonius]